MKRIISRLTMRYIQTLFNDTVSGETVCLYRDRYGEEYIAAYPFHFFKFRTKR